MPDQIKVQKPPAEAPAEGEETPTLAGNLAVMPLRDSVLFPGIIQPLTIGRKRSLALVQDIMLGNRVFCVVTQKNASEEEPPTDNLYRVGCAVRVLKLMRPYAGKAAVMMVLVLIGGEVSQQLLTLAEPVSQERLSQTAARLNAVLAGHSLGEIAALPARTDALEQDILMLILPELRRGAASLFGEIYTDGLSNVFSEPEFAESDSARRALKLLEERSTLRDLLARTTLNSAVGGLQVLIGREGGWEELRQCSMVLARYGVPGFATGALGVIGPMRMSYAKTIPTVRFVAGLLSGLVNDRIGGEQAQQ